MKFHSISGSCLLTGVYLRSFVTIHTWLLRSYVSIVYCCLPFAVASTVGGHEDVADWWMLLLHLQPRSARLHSVHHLRASVVIRLSAPIQSLTLERLIYEKIYYVSSGTIKPTHPFTQFSSILWSSCIWHGVYRIKMTENVYTRVDMTAKQKQQA